MINKIKSMWNLLKSEHYLLLTPKTFNAVYPNKNHTDIIAQWAKVYEKLDKKDKGEI